jgi:hypothetical protein
LAHVSFFGISAIYGRFNSNQTCSPEGHHDSWREVPSVGTAEHSASVEEEGLGEAVGEALVLSIGLSGGGLFAGVSFAGTSSAAPVAVTSSLLLQR